MNERVISECGIGKDLEGSSCGLIIRNYPSIYLKELRKANEMSQSENLVSGLRFECRTSQI
jgi:hypothetical protein